MVRLCFRLWTRASFNNGKCRNGHRARQRACTNCSRRRRRVTPTHCACSFEGRSISYAELNAAANRLARHLQTIGVKPGDLVGIQVPRSIDMVVALLAVLKAGAAYVPLDPTYPAERLSFMAADARLRVVITRSDVQQRRSGRARRQARRRRPALRGASGRRPWYRR